MMSGGMEDTKALTTPSLNYDYLPSVEDIYARKFTGDSRTDPVGGRKKHSWYVLFKKDDQLFPKEKIRGELEAIGRFLKFEMSARDITFKLMKSPLEPFTSKGGAEFTLEYPMKEYGPIERGSKMRRTVRQARLVYISAAIPSGAIDPIRAKFYSSNNIVRFMTFHNSYDWEHAGEDNELLL
uniref:Uncharacterized protein n=1 Tax=Zooxanthella nutricula TaxID=1333877 RepID=A0A7S2PN99_9DINO